MRRSPWWRDANDMARHIVAEEAHRMSLMSPTVEVELVIVGIGIGIAVIAVSLHSSNVAVAGMFITVLAGYAVWLDWRR